MSPNEDPRDTCMLKYMAMVPDKVPCFAHECGMLTHKNVSPPWIHPKTIQQEFICPQLVHASVNFLWSKPHVHTFTNFISMLLDILWISKPWKSKCNILKFSWIYKKKPRKFMLNTSHNYKDPPIICIIFDHQQNQTNVEHFVMQRNQRPVDRKLIHRVSSLLTMFMVGGATRCDLYIFVCFP